MQKVYQFMKLTCILLIILPYVGAAQTKVAKLDEMISMYEKFGYINGTILVIDSGKTFYQKAFGKADFDWDIPNTLDTKFKIGSLTKPITASLILKLVQEKKISLSNTINDFLPWYPEQGKRITIHQLLNHTSGIPSFTNRPDLDQINKFRVNPDTFVLRYCAAPLEFEPGAVFRYNNSAYFILGVIIEKVTNLNYDQALKKYLFAPLKMTNSGFFHNDTIIAHRAKGYTTTLNGFAPASYYDMSIPFSAGGITSTAKDLQNWMNIFWDPAFLHDSLIRKTNMGSISIRPGQGYSYGWYVEKKLLPGREVTVVSHGGEVDGFNNIIIRVPEDKKIIVFFNNTGVTKIREIGFNILNILYEQPIEVPKKNLNTWIGASLLQNGAEKTFTALNALDKKEYAPLHPEELGTWARYLLRLNRPAEALMIVQLLTKINPQSFFAYTFLGDIYKRMGEKELARNAYLESLKISPGNPLATRGLEELR